MAVAFAARSAGSAHGADHALVGAYGGLALPLLAYAVVSATLGGESLARAGRSLVGFGAAPWIVAVAQVSVAALASALLGAALAAGVAAVAHGSSDPPIAGDIATSAWIGALAAAAYATYFSFGSSFGKRGGGRAALLVFDWVLGSGSGALAVITPRAHLRNLLGGTPPLELAERTSAILLAAITLAFALLAAHRARR
jgi:hypothetical protein